MFKEIKTDISAILDRDPAARSALEVFFMYPGFKALMRHRIAHRLYKNLSEMSTKILIFFSYNFKKAILHIFLCI